MHTALDLSNGCMSVPSCALVPLLAAEGLTRLAHFELAMADPPPILAENGQNFSGLIKTCLHAFRKYGPHDKLTQCTPRHRRGGPYRNMAMSPVTGNRSVG